MSNKSPEVFAAFIGLDWADAKHDVCVQAAGTARREVGVLEHSPAAIDVWGSNPAHAVQRTTRCRVP